MKRFEDLKAKYDEVFTFVTSEIGAGYDMEFRNYFMSASLKIWSTNALYSVDYADAFRAVANEQYTVEQMVTAMSCAGDSDRTLLVPAFLKSFIEKDLEQGTRICADFIDQLNELLIASAMINGDFTIGEANAVADIVRYLTGYCNQNGLSFSAATANKQTTALNQESYVLKRAEPIAPVQQEPEQEVIPVANAPKATEIPLNITLKLNVTGADGESILGGDEPDSLKDSGPLGKTEKPEETPSQETLESLLAELDGLVGLETVKRDVHSLMNFIKVSKLRSDRGMKVPTISYHLVFTGNPGTGKTTVARLVAKLYYQMGLLAQGQLVETDRSALVAGYLGQTAIKTQKVIQTALGGVLFIDEAYALANDDQDSYGKEAIETILKAMEDHRDELVVIVAGYDELMHKFIDSNPGLASRFNKYFNFPDYTGEEMLKIFRRFCKTNGYEIDVEVESFLCERFGEMYATREEHFGNARTVRNLFEKTINCQADRIAQQITITDKDLEMLSKEDVLKAMGV